MTNLANRLPDRQPPLSAAAFNARRDINRDKYAASGYIEPGRHYDGAFADDVFGPGGMWTSNAIVQGIRFGRNSRDGIGQSNSGNPVFHVDGLVITMAGLNWGNEENNQINLPDAPTAQIESTTLTTRDYNQGDHIVVGNTIYVCVHPDGAPEGSVLSDEILFERDDAVSREDLVGLEVFLVELGDDDGAVDAVYPYGNVQYSATTWGGYSLSSTRMPQSYSAMFLGDTKTIGRGLQWSVMTPETRNKWAQAAENNIFVENGKYYQWQYRARVIKSRGGEWHIATAWDSTNWALRDRRTFQTDNSNNRYPTLQGSALTANPDATSTADLNYGVSYYLTTLNNGFPKDITQGVSATGITTDSKTRSVGGIGYFLSLAKVARLNQGGYHPIYNPLGTKTFRRQDINGDNRWDNVNTFQPSSVAECFQVGETAQSEGIYEHSGLLGSQRSGHPQDYRSDIIYGWQVEDLRMDATGFNVNPDEFANKLLYNNQQAFEPYKLLRLMPATVGELVGGNGFYVDEEVLEEGGLVNAYAGGAYFYNHDKDEIVPISIYNHSSGRIFAQRLRPEVTPENITSFYSSSLLYNDTPLGWEPGDAVTMIGYKTTYQNSGLIECTDIMATPQRLIEVFAEYGVDRVLGATWIPERIGSNGAAGVVCKARRRVENVYATYHKLPDSITVKTVYNSDFESEANAATITEDDTHFIMLFYNTPATALMPYHLSTRLLDGEFGSVWATDTSSSDLGGTLCFNMTGKVPEGNDWVESNAFQIQKTGMQYSSSTDFDSVSTSSYSEISHVDINYPFRSNGVKFAPFFTVDESRGLIFGQTMFKEVRATVGVREYRTIDVSSGVDVTIVKGERFKLVGTGQTNLDNRYLIALYSYSATWSPGAFRGYTFDPDDGRIYTGAGHIWNGARLDVISLDGDDGTIEPTSGMVMVSDLNNQFVRRGTMITRRAIGFLPKRKRRNKM